MENIDVSDLVKRLGSEDDAVRKMAAFRLQSAIADPSFADVLISEGGLARLRNLALRASGNTLAYSLASFARLLEVDKGWEFVDQELVERIVELIVTHPLVNILRGAMSILVSIVSHPNCDGTPGTAGPAMFGFRALKPAIAIHPQFLEMLVSRLSSADHALCANALQLINSLMRDSLTNDSETEWPRFIKKLQDLGVIRAVYVLMQGSALQDHAHPLIEFQSLTKVLLRKWRDVPLDMEKPEHKRALKEIYTAAGNISDIYNPNNSSSNNAAAAGSLKRNDPEEWRRLGFEIETPVAEFSEMGYLGIMDLVDYARRHQDEFQTILLEQSTKPPEQRCPVARASLAITAILYEHFEVEKSEVDDTKNYLVLDSRSNELDKLFKPLLLHWTRLHVAGLHAFLRLWKTTKAEKEDFDKIVELVRILVESVVGGATRTKDIQDVEEELPEFEYTRLRELQMELLELTYEDVWGEHLRQVRDELNHEAFQFVKEQRIRCLLQGAWFRNEAEGKQDGSSAGDGSGTQMKAAAGASSYKFVKLSHNRRFLHFGDFDRIAPESPDLDALPERIDLFTVSSVVSNVSASPDDSSSSLTVKNSNKNHQNQSASTKITIYGYAPSHTAASTVPSASTTTHHHHQRSQHSVGGGAPTRSASKSISGKEMEIILLLLRPHSHSIASEWLDGLLMLLNQQPITSETNKLIDLISNYGLKIRLFNVRFDDAAFAGDAPKVPSRKGLDEDYYYDVFGGA